MTDYEFLDLFGLCHRCRKEKQVHGKKYCFDCLEKIREEDSKRYDSQKAKEYQSRRREIYRLKKAAGICVRCSSPATHGMYCYNHYIQEKRKSAENAGRRKRERHERGLIPEQRKKDNLCRWCGKPVISGLQCCEEHQKIFSKAGKKRGA